MPNANAPAPIIDPRLGSMLISAANHLDATASSAPGAALAFGPPAAADEVGTLGPYRVVRELGRGSMGAVCLALDMRLDRSLALKVMLPAFAADAEAKARFLREARAAAKISHDNVVTVYEADERDGVPYIAMQLLRGYPLDAFLQKKGNPSLRNAVRIAREAALGLAAAHKLGIVHRDIKPANLWLEAPAVSANSANSSRTTSTSTRPDLPRSETVERGASPLPSRERITLASSRSAQPERLPRIDHAGSGPEGPMTEAEWLASNDPKAMLDLPGDRRGGA